MGIMFTKNKKFTLFSILLSLGLVFYLRSNTDPSGTNLKERILASGTYTSTIGGYTITDTTKVTDACGHRDVRSSLSDSETAKKQKELDDKFYIKGRDKIKEYLKDTDSKYIKEYAQANAAAYLGPAIFLVLSVLCCIFQLIWILTFSYCRPDNPEEGCCRGPGCQKCSFWSSLIWPLLVFAVTVGWIIESGKMIDTLDDTKCGVVSIVNHIKNGVNYQSSSGTYSQFSGMKGYSYLFAEFLTNIGNTRSKTNAANIVLQQFNTQGTTMYNT